MRNLIFAINLTIDGCCDHTKGIVDEETLEYHTQLVQDADLFVYGRKTYQLMVPYWPDIAKNHSGQTEAGNRFAQAFDSMDKAEGKNTEITYAWDLSLSHVGKSHGAKQVIGESDPE